MMETCCWSEVLKYVKVQAIDADAIFRDGARVQYTIGRGLLHEGVMECLSLIFIALDSLLSRLSMVHNN